MREAIRERGREQAEVRAHLARLDGVNGGSPDLDLDRLSDDLQKRVADW